MSATRKLRLRPEALTRPIDQARIQIDTDDARPTLDERLRHLTARAADVEHALAANLARHREDRGPLVRDLDRVDGRIVRVQIRHLVVVGEGAPSILGHRPIMPPVKRCREAPQKYWALTAFSTPDARSPPPLLTPSPHPKAHRIDIYSDRWHPSSRTVNVDPPPLSAPLPASAGLDAKRQLLEEVAGPPSHRSRRQTEPDTR